MSLHHFLLEKIDLYINLKSLLLYDFWNSMEWEGEKWKPEVCTFGLSEKKISANSRKPNKHYYLYYIFRLFARSEVYIFVLLKKIECRWCRTIFHICRSCWTGQAYCCDECRKEGIHHAHRKAQKRYRQTAKGKKAHIEAEKRRRKRLANKNEKNMDDGTSIGEPERCKVSPCGIQPAKSANKFYTKVSLNKKNHCYCHFCGSFGKIVSDFPRRGYG